MTHDTGYWRWSSMPVTSWGGLHGSVVAIFPALIISGVISNIFPWVILMTLGLGLVYMVYCIYCAAHKKGPLEMASWLYTKHFQRGTWSVD